MEKPRLLKADEIEVRVKQVGETYAQLLLYKTARADMDILDETYGPENWQNDYKTIKDNMYCGIGVFNGTSWVWKWDCGTESNTEKEKGEASDSFKRASVRWGIGRELYTSPKIAALCEAMGGVKKDGNFWKLNYPYKKSSVKKITYNDDRTINKLTIVDDRGNIIWSNDRS